MTPREFELKHDGLMEFEAWKAITNRRAMNEEKISIDILLDRELENEPGEVVSIEDHINLMDEIESRINNAS